MGGVEEGYNRGLIVWGTVSVFRFQGLNCLLRIKDVLETASHDEFMSVVTQT